MSSIRRIPASRLEVGMYITERTEGLADGKIQEKGFIQREETLAKLQAKGIPEFYIDISKGKDSAWSLPLAASEAPIKPMLTLKSERRRAQKVYGEARDLVSNLFHNVKMGKAIDVAPMEKLAADINKSILSNPNALQCLSQIREKDKYLLEHSVNVGILMSIFSTFLGYDKKTVQELTTGALLHDIGKIRVSDRVLHKPGKLLPDEWEEMKRHVVYGQEVLAQSPGISDIAKSISALHHERLDGTGYPNGVAGENIDVYGRLAAIVDVYDAVTATRCYHQGMSPFKAMKLLVSMAGTHFDKELVYSFIRCMSVYPVGTLLELDNGLLGVVIEANIEAPNKPLLRIFYNLAQKLPEKPVELDLTKDEHEILRTWHADELGMDISGFL